jgi:hypothetical protein
MPRGRRGLERMLRRWQDLAPNVPPTPKYGAEGVCLSEHGVETERRSWPRLTLSIPVFVRSRDEKGKEFLEFATTLNISAGGMLVAVRRPLPLSARLQLEIPSAPLAETAKVPKSSRALRARCVRITHAADYHLAGLKFVRPLSEDASSSGAARRKVTSAGVKRFSLSPAPCRA